MKGEGTPLAYVPREVPVPARTAPRSHITPGWTVYTATAALRTRLGGSHAWRDVFFQLLIAAAKQAGRDRERRALVAERAALKPGAVAAWMNVGAGSLRFRGRAPNSSRWSDRRSNYGDRRHRPWTP